MTDTITLLSFSYKVGVQFGDPPIETYDCRSIVNPHRVDTLRAMDGRDKAVQHYVQSDAEAQRIFEYALALARRTPGGTIAFGCYGGRHRSVAMAEWVGRHLRHDGRKVEVKHQQLVSASAH